MEQCNMVLRVLCLCAQWCRTCDDYRQPFEDLAGRWPAVRFEWIDIEDQADRVGELDIENFPTILIVRGDSPVFFGTVLPHIEVVERTLQRAQDPRNDARVSIELMEQLPVLLSTGTPQCSSPKP
jgi:thiol-disulfide isomerase/thioredoxin